MWLHWCEKRMCSLMDICIVKKKYIQDGHKSMYKKAKIDIADT